jgi:carbamoyltransferase
VRILGLSAFYHDSAAALIEDGRIVAAAQEERFTRRKHDKRFPENAVGYCLEAARAGLDAVDWVAFYDKPFLWRWRRAASPRSAWRCRCG